MIMETMKAAPAQARQGRAPATRPATWSRRAVWLLKVVVVWVATLWADRRQIITVATVCATFIVLSFLLSPKTGRGLLPMCAWCKRIQKEAGTWERLGLH
jgi:hypothetical protein